MHLGKIPAAGSQLFPDIGNRVDADHIDTFVGQVQHIVNHLIENHRIPVVQIPLIGIESGHDKLFMSGSQVKFPGAVVGNTWGTVFSNSAGTS